ncbi:MAG: carbonic anhydrase, partial [Firmicutes bacterium]|nr:carbonic anhydrase [Bacillota bacterium]
RSLEEWLAGFDSVEESVLQSVDIIRNHPLLPNGVPVHGLVIDPETGKLDLITEGSD